MRNAMTTRAPGGANKMFIKLLKNRKVAKSQNQPSDKEEDEDDEYGVGEKRKKTENDCGMEEFKKFFLMKTDKTEKPKKEIIMMKSFKKLLDNWNDARI